MKKTVYILSASLLVGIALSFLFSKSQPEQLVGATSYKINPFTGELDRVDTSSGGGSTTTLTATQVAYGSPDNTVTSSANFTFNSSTNQLLVPNVSSTNVTTTKVSVSNYTDFSETSSPATPMSDNIRVWAEDAGGFSHLHFKDSAGLDYEIARDNIHTVRNNTTSTISKGQWVYITGSTGVFPTVALAKADTSTTGAAFGIAVADISTNSFGQVMTLGDVQNVNTSAFLDGDVLYLSPTIAGEATTTAPTSTYIFQRLGVVVKSSAGAGIIAVTIGGEFDPTMTQTLTNKTLTGAIIENSSIGASLPSTGNFTSVTSTNLSISGLTSLTGLTFTNASGTSVTTTNLSVSGALALPANSVTDAMVVAGLTISGGTIENTPIGASTPSTAIFTNATTTNLNVGGLVVTNPARFASGDSSSPAIYLSTDSNTGFYSVVDGVTGYVSNAAVQLLFGANTGLGAPTKSIRLEDSVGIGWSTNPVAVSDDALIYLSAANTLSVIGTSLFTVEGVITSTALITTNATTTNLSVSGLTAIQGLTFTNATGTGYLSIATTTITGGFFQTDFTDCDADNQTVAYDVTTGKFGCGDDDSGAGAVSLTNTLLAFGDAANQITSSTALSFNTTSLRLIVNGTVSSTNGLFINATSTNFNVTGLSFSTANGTSITSTNASFSNTVIGAGTFNSLQGIGFSSVQAFVGQFTGLTVAGGFTVGSVSTTGSSGDSKFVGLTFTNATGTAQLRIATTTITGGFNQTGLGDCDTNSSSLRYDSTTQKIQCAQIGSREFTYIVTSTGSSVWTKPATSTGFIGVRVWCVGGGGGGGGSGTAGNIGAGGGGGGCSYRTISAAQLSATTSVVVGAAGALGAAGNNAGTSGGTSSFGSFISCTGGTGGLAGNGASTQSTGGVGSGGNINGSGRNGRESGAYTDSYRGYGGAACTNQGDVSADQLQDSLSNTMSGGGILGMWGGGGGQRPGNWDANSRNGNGGQYFGGGGSGGQKVGAGADAAGAAGTQGVIVIQELYQ